MAVNLLKLFKDMAGRKLVDHASSLLNENGPDVEKALDGILPTIMGGIVDKGSSQKGAESLLKIIEKDNYDGGLIENIGDLFSDGGGGKLDNVLNQGDGLLSKILGNEQKQSGVIDMISNFAGIRKNSTHSLLKLVAPLAMSLLGKKVSSKGLKAAGLMTLLTGQTDYIKNALPPKLAGITKLLNFGGKMAKVGSAMHAGAHGGEDTTGEAGSSGSSWWPWVLGIAAVALLIFLFTGNADDEMEQVSSTVTEEVEQAGEAVQNTVNSMEESVASTASVGTRITEAMDNGQTLNGMEFTFAHYDFAEGSSQPGSNVSAELNELAEIMKANPGMNVNLTTYAPGNAELAQQRSLAVKSRLQELGVSSERVTTDSHAAAAGEGGAIVLRVTSM